MHDDSSTAAEMQDTFDSSAVMEQEGKRDSLGCISMFQGPPKRFIRTIKPVAGSSFNVRLLLLPVELPSASLWPPQVHVVVRAAWHAWLGMCNDEKSGLGCAEASCGRWED